MTEPFDQTASIGPDGPSGPHSGPRDITGTVVGGRYKILGVLGEGGMGTVYEAEQASPKRAVALKVVRAGYLSPQLLRRFEQESLVLGKLQHPGIAQVYEAGMLADEHAHDVPFFAMELVRGVPLTDYADANKLGTRDRLDLVAKICDAVYHAHQKGVIHRDLKPGNILVDESGQPKVLDFGVARATDADIQTATLQTDIGQLIGTVPYMSPEQVSGDPSDLDTRSDVYALGVIAYELLAGRLPYQLKQKMIHEAARIIKEEEPTRLSSISRTLRGDVETIVAKALDKEKTRRYQSAESLASDIRRYLHDEPIEARPASTWYQLQKFSRRNTGLVAGLVAAFVLLLAGLVGTSLGLAEASHQAALARDAAEAESEQRALAVARAEEADAARLEADRRAEELQLVADFQSEQLGEIEAEVMGAQLRRSIIEGASEEARAALTDALAPVNFTSIALGTLEANIFERTIEAIDAQFESQPLVRAQLLHSVSDTLTKLGLYDLANEPQERALAIRREQLGDDHPGTLRSIYNLGILLQEQGRLDLAEAYLRESLEGHRRVLGDDHPSTLIAINYMGKLLSAQGRLDESEAYYREALDGNRRVLGNDHRYTLALINNMGGILHSRGRLDESQAYYREALDGYRRVLGNDDPSTLTLIGNLGFILWVQDRHAEAETYTREALDGRRRVLGNDHPQTLASINNMGALLHAQGQLDEAETYWREALNGYRSVLGDDHPDTLRSIYSLGILLHAQGRLDETETYWNEALDGYRRVLGVDHPDTLTAIGSMAVFLEESRGKREEAEEYYREALGGCRRVFGDDHPDTLILISILGNLLSEQGRLDEAEAYYRESLDARRRAEPEGSAGVGSSLVQLGMNLLAQGKWAEAEPILVECVQVRERVLPAGHWLLWNTRSLLGEAIAGQAPADPARFAEAEALLVEAIEKIDPPEQLANRTHQAVQRVIDLYTAWHAAEPGEGYDAEAADWRAKLVEQGGSPDDHASP